MMPAKIDFMDCIVYNNINRTHHASDFSCATRWDFFIYGVFYVSVSKTNINNSTAGTIIY